MKSIAIFFIIILSSNIASAMIVGLSYEPDLQLAIENISIEENNLDIEPAECCSSDTNETDDCCEGDCDCSCCHQVTTSSCQINNQFRALDFVLNDSPQTRQVFSYQSPLSCETSFQLLEPPQLG